MAYEYQEWPSYCVGPAGEREVFENEGQVPSGWELPSGKIKGAKTQTAPVPTPPQPVAEKLTAPVEGVALPPQEEESEFDKSGAKWDPELHTSTKRLTSAGLWKMKPGVARPPLDL